MATCGVCFEAYNEAERRPKVLLCGHSFCLSCLLALEARQPGLIQCPNCQQQVLRRGATEFVDNFALLSLGGKCISQTFFCLNCSREASPACLSDVHDLRLLGAHLRDLQGRLQETVTELRGQVLAALNVTPKSGRVEQLDQELQLLGCRDTVTISCDTWRAEALQLQQEPAVRAAMLVLLRQGRLQRQDKEREACGHRVQPSAAQVQLDLDCLSRGASPGVWRGDTAAVMQRDAVHVLKKMWCDYDPAWVLQMLRQHAASLQDVELLKVSRDHLLELRSLPRLRRLLVWCCQPDLEDSPALPGPWRGRLQWLRVEFLPKQTVQSLLSAQRDSLQELELRVGTPPQAGEEERWPLTCSDLPAMLRGLQLQALVLQRVDFPSHSGCPAQLAALRAALPGCTVTCSKCSG